MKNEIEVKKSQIPKLGPTLLGFVCDPYQIHFFSVGLTFYIKTIKYGVNFSR